MRERAGDGRARRRRRAGALSVPRSRAGISGAHVTGGKNAHGHGAEELKAILVGRIVSGKPYSRAEVYESGAVTRPLQVPNSLDRLQAMNRALADYSQTARKRSVNPATFVPFETLPGNSADLKDRSVCWK